MRRGGAALERVVVFVIGAALLAVGAGAAAWQLDWIPDAVSSLDASEPLGWADEDWWPWVLGGAGIVLILIGLSWLTAHLRRPGMRRVRLADSSGKGRLTVDGSTLVDSALDVLDATPGMRARSGRVVREGKHLVTDLRAGIDPGADLDEATDAAQRAASVLGAHLGPKASARCRVLLTRGGTRAKVSRVR